MSNPYQTPMSNDRVYVSGEMLPCIGCGKELHATAAVCPGCGATQRQRKYKSKTVAAVLAFFLGGLGVHRFYLGQWWGIFYLLFFWLWIPAIIALIEFIVFLATDQRSWDEKYNEGKPAAPNEQGGSAIIIAIVAIIAAVMILGMVAAVAIPAYQQYTLRVQVSEALNETSYVRQRVSDYLNAQGQLPSDNRALDLPQPLTLSKGHQIFLSPKGIELRLSGRPALAGKTIVLTPVPQQGFIDWDCRGGTLEREYRPVSCR
jgi:TM2 domain-containing membrane protein YozV/Tfp pilus assembly protein PilE